MVDTPRTIAALQTLFADNTSGDISAQDLRDFLVTVIDYLDGVTITPSDPDDVPLKIVTSDQTGSDYLDCLMVTDATDQQRFLVDSAGEASLTVMDAGATGLSIFGPNGGTDNHLLQINGTSPTSGLVFDVENGGKVTVGHPTKSVGLKLAGPLSAPSSGDLDASQLTFWFDNTNGAAKLMIKAKSANGTVVTGNVALS